ncbi:uncharacterized protein N7496_007674 [Penicillium cataractarum]|uniref:Uncharacterized protein n=1 Tax=Penicillium cataractarum TaxID=2100454 RepID=A0A9W9V4Z6_9EURO|nr:uncharacterized protein N7496_007674 [Penicillium cataractarum]KAJ5367914.1 hypothetical protein N7496_007674 [Penicillium cataractarum]
MQGGFGGANVTARKWIQGREWLCRTLVVGRLFVARSLYGDVVLGSSHAIVVGRFVPTWLRGRRSRRPTPDAC